MTDSVNLDMFGVNYGRLGDRKRRTIYKELGRPGESFADWQVETEKLLSYLTFSLFTIQEREISIEQIVMRLVQLSHPSDSVKYVRLVEAVMNTLRDTNLTTSAVDLASFLRNNDKLIHAEFCRLNELY